MKVDRSFRETFDIEYEKAERLLSYLLHGPMRDSKKTLISDDPKAKI